jgi:N-acetyl-anhydromuramyl-L-alanine amidase AmpD
MAKSSRFGIRYYFAIIAIMTAVVYTFNNYVVGADGLPMPATLRLDVYRNLLFEESITNVSDMFPARQFRTETNYIIVHHDAIEHNIIGGLAPVNLIAEYHMLKYGTFAYHFYITSAGKIYRMHDEREATPHALGYNFNSVSVCLSGNFEIEQPTDAQLEAYKLLMQYLRMRYPNARILGHKETGNDTTCPGFYFDFKNFAL